MKNIFGCLTVFLLICHATYSKGNTAFINKINPVFGTMDLRIAKSSARYYGLQEKKTFSVKEKSPDPSAKGFEIMLQEALTNGIYILLIHQGTKSSKLTQIIK